MHVSYWNGNTPTTLNITLGILLLEKNENVVEYKKLPIGSAVNILKADPCPSLEVLNEKKLRQ